MANASQEIEHQFSEDGIRRINFSCDPQTIRRKRGEWQKFTSHLDPYPGIFRGKGIVICAGGFSYLICAWVNIRLLRKSGCSLPIELWHQEGELTDEMIMELEKLQVSCRRFSDHVNTSDLTSGYQLKPLAVLYSNFKEILLLDADNNCLRNPAYLFDSDIYKKEGAIFWPDYWKSEKTNPIWDIVGSKDYGLQEQESGQLLVDKERCWKELNLCAFFNLDSFYYRILWGDKDTFKFAWIALKTSFHMMRKGVGAVGFETSDFGFGAIAMGQYDYDGDLLFIHSNLLKWHERASEKLLWQEIRSIDEASEKKIMMKYHSGFETYFLQIEGDRRIISEDDAIADLERTSLEELRELRRTTLYSGLEQQLQ